MKTSEKLLAEIETADNGDGPTPQSSVTDSPLACVISAATEVQAAEARLDRCVQKAREAGKTWQQIADALHMTKQGAHKKFAHTPEAA